MTLIRVRHTGLCTLSAALLISAAAAQPLPDQPMLGQKPPSARQNKAVPSVPAAVMNDHLERIPKCYIIGGMRQAGPGRFEYVDLSGHVIPSLSVPPLPRITPVIVPQAAAKPLSGIAEPLDTRRSALP